MNSYNFLVLSENDFNSKMEKTNIPKDGKYLIRIHTCIHSQDNIMPFVKTVVEYFPNAKVIGSSTSGVLYKGDIHTDSCLISVTELENSEVKTCLVDLSDSDGNDVSGSYAADNVIDSVISGNSQFMLIFFSRPFIKVNSFVNRFNERAAMVQLIGGIANTQKNPEVNLQLDAFVFDNERVSNNSVAAAVIDSKHLNKYSDIIYVTEPVGHTHTITDADGMIIRAIDGKNAVEWYQEQLGIDLSGSSEYETTVLFPLVRSDYGDIPWALSYSPQNESLKVFEYESEPVMFVPSEAKVGEKVRISYSSVQKTIEVCESVCHDISTHPSEVFFGYSCVSRQNLFQNCAKWELMPFRNTNLSGALVAGEIGNMENINRYCNYSFTVASLAENAGRAMIDIDVIREKSGKLVNDQEHIVKYLVNVNKSANGDIARNQQDIETALFMDDDLKICNITKYSFDFSMGKFDKICMISFRNEGLLNAFMSKSKFNMCLFRFHKAIMGFIGNDAYSCYVYKKSILVLTCSSTVSDREFIDTMKSVQSFVSEYRFAEYIPVSEFSLVMHEEDMINKAELTLMSMRAKNKFFLHYVPDMGLEQMHARKMKMLKILNDAVANDRVVPFFQGIRDNSAGRINMYESLMRIKDNEGNVYAPGQFMEIAKEYGFYPDISQLMIVKTMNFFRDRSETVTMNLNISDISNYKIVHFILSYLKNAPHPENYVFELTETEEIHDYQIITNFADRIHELGAKIAIDDFGSGFSNIVNLFKIESDYIKIDGEIVKNINTDIYARELLEMIAIWAGKHNKEIVAEYIENQDIQDIVHEKGIRYSQGYLFSQPAEKLIEE